MAKNIFDHLKAITIHKEPWNLLSEADKKSWDDYMITRWLSMNPDNISYLNELQVVRNSNFESKDYYNLLLYSLPNKYFYTKYIKKPHTFEEKKRLLEFLSTVYKVSKRECLDIIEIFRTFKLDAEFEDMMTKYGIQENDKNDLRKEMFDDKK